jgi:uncharacterized membrane protein YhaH (DUF805 family)
MDNMYAAPSADLTLSASSDETYQPRVFAVTGRIGRLRYLAYGIALNLALLFCAGMLAAAVIPLFDDKDSAGMVAIAGMLLFYIPVLAIAFIMAKRRLNDLNQSGWLSLLLIVPLVNFFFGLFMLIAPGTRGSNNYGPAPTPNPVSVVLAACIVPLVFVLGIVAAIAIPAYQQYVIRAKAAGGQVNR